MIIKRLTVENVGPFFGSWEVLLETGVTVFVGEYEGAEDRSNRSGKSWLAVDVPTYAIFGVFRGARVEDLPHRLVRGRESAWAEVEVESSDGLEWVVRRGRTAGGDPIRELNGSQISERDLERVVREEVVGLSWEEYLLTLGAVQGEMHAFMRLTAGEKRRVVSPWFSTDRWVPRADLARVRLLRAQSKLWELTEEERVLREMLAGMSDLVDAERLAHVSYEEASARYASCLEARLAADARFKARGERRAKFERLSADVARLSADVAAEMSAAIRAHSCAEDGLTLGYAELRRAQERAECARTLERQEVELEERRSLVGEVLAGVTRQEGEEESHAREREELLTRYRELERTRTGVCPILREGCDRVVRDEGVLRKMKVEGLGHRRAFLRAAELLKELRWKLDMSRADVDLAEASVKQLRDLRGMRTVTQAEADVEVLKRNRDVALSALNRVKTGRTEAALALHRTKKELAQLSGEGGDGEGLDELSELSELVEEYQAECRELEEDLVNARAAVAEVRRAEERLVEIVSSREVTSAHVERLAWASYAFGAAGIPSRELENAFGVAEDSMNRVLRELQTPLRVAFAPTRELQDWEAACLGCGTAFQKGERTHVCALCGAPRRRRRRDELRLEVQDGGNSASWEVDSGGGKVLLSLGVRLGLAALPGSRRRVRCESLLIDEPDGALDEPNRAALHALLIGGLGSLGVRQTLLVTHADVRREFRNVVVVHRWEAEDRSGAWNE